ncbi:sensor histidine kinase [Aquamicrobium ahrensii]|uniref:histidine kinase n=1 Tax=Aquamicrobium ahrensii TaxID=469551 RepID=A0ABV2KNR4_9HYPH
MGSQIDPRKPRSVDDEVIDPSLRDESQLGRALLHALRNAGVSVLYQDNDLRTVWARNMAAPWMQGRQGDTILPPSQTARIIAAREDAISNGNTHRFEISAPGDDGLRWFEIWVDPDRDDDGEIRGVMTTKVETTERKRREQSLRALLREVSHRSRNLLAIIQSIASQTGRHSGNISDFLASFQGRLQSLAASQDLVTSSNWRGAELRELIHGQIGHNAAYSESELNFEGVNPYLNPNAALHIGLAMHELVVNSLSYGALSHPEGRIDIQAVMEDGVSKSDAPSLLLSWVEQLDQGSVLPPHRDFRRVTLERVVPAALSGQASLELVEGLLEYRLVIPASNFESASEPDAAS